MKTKLLMTLVLLVTSGILVYGFSSGENPYQKSYSPSLENAPKIVYGPSIDAPLSALSESFEGATFPPAGWAKFSPLGRTSWTRQTAGTTPVPGFLGGVITTPTGGGSACAFVTYTSSAQNSEWLMTPQITNVQPGDSLSFWLRYWPQQYPDSFLVKISTTTQTIAAMTTNLWTKRFNGPVDSGWVQFKFRMGNTVPAGSNIYIGFLESFFDGATFSLDLVNYIPASAPPPNPTTWYEQTSGTTGALYSVSAPDINNVWIAGAAGKILRTTNGGTWTSVTAPDANAQYCIWGFDANNAITTSSSASATFVFRTTNGGTNWTQVFNQTGGFIDGFYFKDANNGIMYGDPVGGRLQVWRTTNGGANWDSTGQNITTAAAGWNNAMCGFGDNVWIGTNTVSVFKSTNFGGNWSTQTALQTNGYALWFNSATVGLLGGTELNVTTNGGTNWAAMTSLGTGNASGLTGYGTNWWFTRQATGVYASTNNGANWSTAYTAPAGNFYHISMSRTGSPYLYAVRSNGGISKYGGSATGVTPVTTVADNYSLSQNYPNPFNPTTNIKFAIPQSGFVTLKIYNMLGKEVATLVSSNLSKGSYSYDFNASNLASGIYFYKLEAGNFSEVKKMSLVK